MRTEDRTIPTVVVALMVLVGSATVSAMPGKDGPFKKVDRSIVTMVERATATRATPAGRHTRLDSEGKAVLAVVETVGDGRLAAGALAAAGLRAEQVAGTSTLGWLPFERMAEVASLPQVLRIRRPVPAIWDVTSQGVFISGADLTHTTGARGQGVKIGVIDVFEGYGAALGVELPPADRVQFRSFIAGGGAGGENHGVLVAEILTDMAPEASLYLASIEDDIGFINAVQWMIAEGVDVINHSGGFGLFGDMKGNGPVHFVIADATAAGILYVEAAGNSATSHWEGLFVDSNGNGQAEFGGGVERLTFQVPSGGDMQLRVDLTWDDWVPNPADPRPTTDYDICLYDSAGAALACSLAPQDGSPGQIPFEVIDHTLPGAGTYSLGIDRFAGGSLHMELILLPDYSLGSFNMPDSSVIAPADHRDAFTVGATGLDDRVRGYSSRGPTNDGRLKPEISATDGVITSFGGFFGTSASCPHVAGAAALLKSFEPGLSGAQLRQRLIDRAVQVGPDTVAGPDNLYGFGRLDANYANLATPTPTPTATPTPTTVTPRNSGGGGCRLLGGGGAPESLLFSLLLVLGYGVWRRGGVR